MSPYPHRVVGTEVSGKQIMASEHIRTKLVGITLDADEFTLEENLGSDYVVDIGSLFGKLDNGLYCLWARQAIAVEAAAAQKDVVVKNAAPFKVGDAVTLLDDDDLTETAVIASIDYDTETLTMTENLSETYTLANNPECYITDGGDIDEVVLGYSDVDMELKVRGAASSIGDQLTSVLKHGAVLKARLPQWVQDALDYVTGCTGDVEYGVKRFLEGKGGNQIEFVE